ncbi:Ger(x)C family spore germination C-terminal domain-containing protein [Paenibacillus pasadenensis]|uniref:Uncharacterized protein n=1 Tax=Paenibacillus pasadenensis TaxID=217090 RepID=A0A2N5NBG1_9BACL|nr:MULTISPECIES: Ger(x)C family spore germination C-terminal domain-containing protein [Paenibacillus]PLT47663.1 hypothetical protein B8V81_1887 [Paenibacillus pasadenensis]QGG57848.1 hypothetical protein GE073_21290 [Paenibacillus sp. B01]
MRRLRLIAAAALLLLLAGCKGSKTNNELYLKAIGIDYKDGIYTMYVQMLDFAGESKSETGTVSGKQIPIWTGHGSGKSIGDANAKLMNSSQQPMDFSHVSALLLTEGALKAMSSRDISELIAGYPESRMNVWMFGTRHKLDDIFITKSFFNLSNTTTLLHSPEASYSQKSDIEPVFLFKLLRELQHPAINGYVPELMLEERAWEKDEKPHPELKVAGAFFFRQAAYETRLPIGQLEGWHWMNPHMEQYLIEIVHDGVDYGYGSFTRTKIKLRLKEDEQGEPAFEARVHVKGVLMTRNTQSPMAEVEEAAAKMIEAQIVSTYRSALSRKIDIFELEELYYRKHPREWQERTDGGAKTLLKPDSLRLAEVRVDLESPGKYKP